MMTRFFAILLVVLGCEISSANPLVATHPAYTAAEHLQVKLLNDAAEIDGRFHFRSPAKPSVDLLGPVAGANVHLQVLIWVPCDPSEADPATATLLRSMKLSSANDLQGRILTAWDAAIGLKISVGEYAMKIKWFAAFDPREKEDLKRLPPEWFRKGYYTIRAYVEFRPDLLDSNPEIRIQYRQSLRRTAAGSEFFYLPIFENLPKEQTTRDLRQYAMYVANHSGHSLSLGTVTAPIGYSMALPLAHHEPIGFTLTPASR